MPPDDDSSKNPFVRFKEHVDAHISAGLQNVFHFPAVLAETVSSSRSVSSNDSTVARSTDTSNHDEYYGSHGHSGSGDRSQSQWHGANAGEVVPYHFRNWLRGQQQATAEEEQVDRYYERQLQASPDSEAVRDLIRSERLDVFAKHSSYSPVRLANMFPRQPRPSDIHPDMDPSMFTFVDAFEDLMAEAAGQPMMELRTRYDLNRWIRQNYPSALPVSAWTKRFEAQGLLKAFFPGSPSPQGDGAVAEHPVAGQEKPTSVEPLDWEHTQHSPKPRVEDWPQPPADGLFGEIDRVMKALNQVLDDTMNGGHKVNGQPPRTPTSENDLYDAVQSAFTEGQRSLSNFFRSLAHGIEPRAPKEMNDETGWSDEKTIGDEEGSKTTKSSREFIDEYGNKHISTEIKTTNRVGTVVSTETHYSVRPATEAELASVEQASREQGHAKTEGPAVGGEHKEEKHAGWFWK